VPRSGLRRQPRGESSHIARNGQVWISLSIVAVQVHVQHPEPVRRPWDRVRCCSDWARSGTCEGGLVGCLLAAVNSPPPPEPFWGRLQRIGSGHRRLRGTPPPAPAAGCSPAPRDPQTSLVPDLLGERRIGKPLDNLRSGALDGGLITGFLREPQQKTQTRVVVLAPVLRKELVEHSLVG